MTCRFLSGKIGVILLLVLATLASRSAGAGNGVNWEFVDLPVTGEVGQAIHFSAAVTNTGDAPWVIDYVVELRAPGAAAPAHVSLATTAPGGPQRRLAQQRE